MVAKHYALGAVSFFFAAVGLIAPAAAQTCKADGDCPQGYTCVSEGVTTEPAPACPPNADCARLAVDGSVSTGTILICEPKTCSVDSDCGAGLVCHDQVSGGCSGGVAQVICAPGTPCDAGTPTKTDPSCTTTTTKQCAFKWELPCNAAADCGDGFTCQPSVAIGCSAGSADGGGGTFSSGGGSSSSGAALFPDSGANAPTPPAVDAGTPPNCTTTTSFPGTCEPKATTCAVDTDCPALWKCTSIALPEPVSAGATSGDAAAIAPVPGGKGVATDAGVEMVCVSPLGGYGYAEPGETSTGGVPNTAGTGAANADGGATPSPPTSSKGGAGASNGLDGTSTAAAGGGCAVAGGGAEPAGLLLLALVGMSCARRRRSR
jgi:hypothetical protein